MPAAAPVPLPTPPAAPSTSTHTTKDPYSLPPATPEQVFVEKKRRAGAVPPPLQMPEVQPGAPSPMAGTPQGVVPSPHHAPQMLHHPQMHDGYGYHHPSPMAVPQYQQYPQPMGHHHGSHMGTPMTPMAPMVMTPMSGPHPTTGFEHPTHMQHPQQYPQMNTGMAMGPMTPMTPMTSMSFMSDNSAHTGVPQHPQMHAVPVQYSMVPPQQQGGYDMHAAHSPMSPTLSTMSGQSSPTYGPTYAPTHEMGYQMQHTYQAAPQQVGYTYEGYGMEGQIQMVDGEMWQDGTDMGRRRDRRNRMKKDENQAVDAMRYKTKMCRNWELTNRCPYGPRCLFAHGRCELRTMAVNTEAICAAARSSSPQRAFYEQGRFPDFVPVPLELMEQMASGVSNVNEIATQMA